MPLNRITGEAMFGIDAFRLAVIVAVVGCSAGWAVDPPKEDKKVPPLADLIKVLKDGTRGEQEKAAVMIRDHYEGKCLEAIPQMVASMGRELNIPYDTPNVPPNSCYLAHHLGQASHKAGPKRFKTLFEMTTDKDPLIRAGAFRMLFAGSEHYLRKVSEWKDEKSELDLAELLKACERGAKDESPLVRGQVMITLRAFTTADETLSKPAAELLAKALEDREVKETYHNYSAAYHAAGTLMGFQAKGKPAFEALLKATASAEPRLARTTAWALGRVANSDEKMAAAALKLFREQLTDPKEAEVVYRAAAEGVGHLGKYAKPAVTEVAALLTLPKCSDELRNAVIGTLYELGSASAPAVPTLLAQLDSTTNAGQQRAILYVISAIGSEARDAAKAIEKWAEKNPNMEGSVRTMMDEALEKIK
jgi:HEAT repeat protein